MSKIFLFLASLVCLTCSTPSTEAKTLVYCLEASPKSLTPPYVSFEANVIIQIFDRLVEFEPDSTQVRPGLAESWEISPDGLIYTFKLRKGIKFHETKGFKPTRDFNADDVVFTFERQLKDNHPYHKVSGGVYAFFNSIGLHKVIESVEKIDDYTVQFKLKQPESPFLVDLAMAFSSIMSVEFADQMLKAGTPEKFDLTPVGTGPFTFVDYQKDDAVRLKANSNYRHGKPKIDNLVFSIVTDPGIRLAKLEKGECHIISYPNLADISKIRKNTNVILLEQEGMNAGFLALNTQKKPLNDARVRKALTMAINKSAIIDAIFQGYGIASINPMSPALWGYNKDIKDHPYNPEQAKKLLAEAGYPNGFEIELWAMPVSRPYNPNGKRTAELIQADWDKIGVRAKIVSYEWGEYLKRAKQGEHQAFMIGWFSDNGDPDNILYSRFGCDAIEAERNFSFWCDEDYNKLVMQAKKVTDVKERTKLYEQAQLILHQELPVIPLTHSRQVISINKKVKGYKQHPLAYDYLYNVDIED